MVARAPLVVDAVDEHGDAVTGALVEVRDRVTLEPADMYAAESDGGPIVGAARTNIDGQLVVFVEAGAYEWRAGGSAWLPFDAPGVDTAAFRNAGFWQPDGVYHRNDVVRARSSSDPFSTFLNYVLAVELPVDPSAPPWQATDSWALFNEANIDAWVEQLQAQIQGDVGNVYAVLRGELDAIVLTPGPQGEQGVQGPAGADGAPGAEGAPGATGPLGPEGPVGLRGIAGAQGAAGAVGPAGAKGDTGETGASGAVGALVMPRAALPSSTRRPFARTCGSSPARGSCTCRKRSRGRRSPRGRRASISCSPGRKDARWRSASGRAASRSAERSEPLRGIFRLEGAGSAGDDGDGAVRLDAVARPAEVVHSL